MSTLMVGTVMTGVIWLFIAVRAVEQSKSLLGRVEAIEAIEAMRLPARNPGTRLL